MSINMSASALMSQLNSSGSYTYTNETTKRTIDEDKVSVQEDCTTISQALRRMQKLDFDSVSGKSQAKKLVKSFVDSYNHLTRMPDEKISSELKRKYKKLDNLLKEYSTELEKVGVKRNSKNQLSFDKLAFASSTNAEEFNAVFRNNSTFVKQFNRYTKSIKSITGQNILQTISAREYVSQNVSKENIRMADSANAVFTSLDALDRFVEANQTRQSLALSYLEEFTDQYNKVFQHEKSTPSGTVSLQQLKDTVCQYSDALREVGIELKDDGVNGTGSLLEFHKDDVASTDDNPETSFMEKLKSLMNDGFKAQMQDAAQKLFCELLSTSKNNIIVDSLA